MSNKQESKTVILKTNFDIVAKINGDTDIDTFLRKNTEFMGEPKDSSGCVISMTLKGWEQYGRK